MASRVFRATVNDVMIAPAQCAAPRSFSAASVNLNANAAVPGLVTSSLSRGRVRVCPLLSRPGAHMRVCSSRASELRCRGNRCRSGSRRQRGCPRACRSLDAAGASGAVLEEEGEGARRPRINWSGQVEQSPRARSAGLLVLHGRLPRSFADNCSPDTSSPPRALLPRRCDSRPPWQGGDRRGPSSARVSVCVCAVRARDAGVCAPPRITTREGLERAASRAPLPMLRVGYDSGTDPCSGCTRTSSAVHEPPQRRPWRLGPEMAPEGRTDARGAPLSRLRWGRAAAAALRGRYLAVQFRARSAAVFAGEAVLLLGLWQDTEPPRFGAAAFRLLGPSNFLARGSANRFAFGLDSERLSAPPRRPAIFGNTDSAG
ncbi:hypothetical protein ISCGN_004987 [Ixodes scapularis]